MAEEDQKPDDPIPNKMHYSYQPSKAELEADVSIDCDPNDLLQAVFNYNPRDEK